MALNAPESSRTDIFTRKLNEAIDVFFRRNITRAASVHPNYQELWESLHALIKSGGKRVRPTLTLLTYEAFGGSDQAAILSIAVAQELLHLSMLIHDDIIDRDYLRYGVANIAGQYVERYKPIVHNAQDRQHFATAAALLGGDVLISAAYQLIAESTVPRHKIIAAQQLFGDSIFEIVGGELLDTESAFRPAGSIDATIVARYKTASYSFIGPMMVGAMLADAPIASQVLLRTFAEYVGIAYQFVDDVLGTFGDSKRTGKTTLGDIREGKRTFMVEQFYAVATAAQQREFDRYFGRATITENQAVIIRQLLIDTGARAKTEATIEHYKVQAYDILDKLELTVTGKDELRRLVAKLTSRTK